MRTQNLISPVAPQTTGHLTLVSEPIRRTFEILEFTLIGREPGAQIQLNDPNVSGRHARIERRPTGFYIRDLRSRNGTFVNGTPVLEARLTDRDRIRTGLSELIFSVEANISQQSSILSSRNAAWDQQLRRLPTLAQSPHPVLLLGPSGTGKEVLAHAIHRLSNRARSPFLSVNCSALSENLAESELFGHLKGSFTGAHEDRKGAFEAARGGTLFLDEVGDIPMGLQPKLLRALENGEIKPVGYDRTLESDVRIIAATNRDLKALVDAKLFREDLYYRLHILQVRPPSLCERSEDFDSLLQHFSGPLRVRWTTEALAELRAYRWPGNIRELKNVVSRAAALYPDRPITHLEIGDVLDRAPEVPAKKSSSGPMLTRQFLKDYEKEAIIERLQYYKGNQRRAAEDLGIAKSTLHDRVHKYGLDLKKFKEPI